MELFVTVIFWVFPVAIGAAVAAAVARFTTERPSGPLLVRARWWWLGAGLVVGGILASFSGFGAAWTASLEGRSETPGMVMFFTGWYAMFGGAGVLAGRAFRYIRAELRNRPEAVAGGRRVRPLAAAVPLTFLAGNVCLFLYLEDVVNGRTGALIAALFFQLGIIASCVLGSLALRAAGRPRAALAFLFAAPWPILGLFILIFMFWESPGIIYLVMAAMVAVMARLAWRLGFRSGPIRRAT